MFYQFIFFVIVAQAGLMATAGVAHPPALRASLFARKGPLNMNTSAECTEPKVRREWRNMEPELQQEYISAVKCLFTKPSTINRNPGASLYDDFTTVHLRLKTSIHYTASFLPWHRYYIHIYESALIDCGYTGTLPYWDWTLDAGPDVPKSPIFDPETGFGGTGEDPTNEEGSPVADGPFNNITVYAHSTQSLVIDYNKPHRLTRFLATFVTFHSSGSFVPASEDGSMNSEDYTPERVERIIDESNTYDAFRRTFEDVPHAAVHIAIGGDMRPSGAPNDPIFFPHHGNVDRVWWHWQQRKPDLAMHYSGNTVQGSSEKDATLDDMLVFSGLYGADDVRVKDVMLTNTALFCYKYAD